ncbi:MAG: formate/nitrite transporter family protein [Ruminococcus sp.]
MFAIAVLLIVFIGAELFTGNNLVMAFGAYDKKVSWAQVGKVWLVSYIGNFRRMPDPLRDFRTGRRFRHRRLLRRLYWEQTFHSCGRNVLPRHSLATSSSASPLPAA